MKMRAWNYANWVAVLLAIGVGPAHTEEPARQRAMPIIFSEPNSDTVSSNLNQLDLKAAPFKGLESELKKPFEIFNSGQSGGRFHPSSGRLAPPTAPVVNNRRIKELIDKRAEMRLLGPDSGDPDLAGDDPFKSPEDSLDAAGRKLKTPLDRYYNRLDRERSAATNQVRNTDLFGSQKESDSKDQFGRAFPDKPFGGDFNASANSLGRLSPNAAGNRGFFSDQLNPKSFNEPLEMRPNGLVERSSAAKESRLDEFKRLLDRPAYTPGPSFYSRSLPATGAAQAPPPASPFPTWGSPSVTAPPGENFTSRAGLVGTPPELQGLPSFAATTPSLNPIPPPVARPKQAPSSFSIPKRQF